MKKLLFAAVALAAGAAHAQSAGTWFGGIGATVRLLFRRGREGHERASLGRFKLVDRD